MGVEREEWAVVNEREATQWLRCASKKRKPQGTEAAEVEAGAEDCGSSLLFAHAPRWLIRGQSKRKKKRKTERKRWVGGCECVWQGIF